MSTNDKDFVVTNGLIVNGTATLSSGMTINNTPISINPITNRIQAYVNDTWVEMALLSDIVPADLSVMNLNIEYNGGN
jgi:tetrahydromethanopterin S-methyltransferase subunit F